MKPEFVRNPYNYDSDEVSQETGLTCTDESLTSQQFLQESDINYIAEKFLRTGEAPQVLNLPTAGDFSGIFDFQSAMNTLAQAKNEFMSLPAKIRNRFSNDPAQLLDFVADKDNYDEAVKLGFIQPKETPDGQSSTGSPETTPEKPARDAGTAATKRQDEGTKKPRRRTDEED
uniref:Minor capsid protein n=1 Tax=Gokushovirinae environmental samples TaxID=1478972 RepID=A0A2R3UAE0_9VIRU|nr:minor capsid protein [Gokushovirinae environmental samples]